MAMDKTDILRAKLKNKKIDRHNLMEEIEDFLKNSKMNYACRAFFTIALTKEKGERKGLNEARYRRYRIIYSFINALLEKNPKLARDYLKGRKKLTIEQWENVNKLVIKDQKDVEEAIRCIIKMQKPSDKEKKKFVSIKKMRKLENEDYIISLIFNMRMWGDLLNRQMDMVLAGDYSHKSRNQLLSVVNELERKLKKMRGVKKDDECR